MGTIKARLIYKRFIGWRGNIRSALWLPCTMLPS